MIRPIRRGPLIVNLFDTNYAYDEGYPEPGINFFSNVRYRF
jgi:iron complex outermembrane receptor protein